MYISKKTIKTNIIILGCILFCGCLHLIGYYVDQIPFSENNVIFMVYSFGMLLWIMQIQRRIIHQKAKLYLLLTAIFMILWMLLRTIKYIYVPSDHIVHRYIWYAYHPLMMSMILFDLFAVLHTGKQEQQAIDAKWYGLYVPTIGFILMFFSNDFHQLAFRFHDPIGWTSTKMSYGIIYYLAQGYILSLFLLTMFIVFLRCLVKGRRKFIWIPMIPISVGILYAVSYVTKSNVLKYLLIAYKPAEMSCIVIGLFTEALILTRLLPSNDNYEQFWKLSSMKAGILDQDGNLYIQSPGVSNIDKKYIYKAQIEMVYLTKDIVLKSKRMFQGYLFWQKNVAQFHFLNHKLKQLKDSILEENEVIAAENQMKEQHAHIKNQRELYDSICNKVKPQVHKISMLLNSIPKEEEAFCNSMKLACIHNVYIKRYTNLMLLYEKDKYHYFEELKLAFIESLDYLTMVHIETYLQWDVNKQQKTTYGLCLYELFQQMVEEALDTVTAILLHVKAEDDCILFELQIANPRAYFSQEDLQKRLGDFVTVKTSYQEDIYYLTMELPMQGGNV